MLPHIIEQLVGAFTSHLPSWRSQSKGTTKKQQHRNTLFPANSSIIFSTESITGVFRISAANPSVSARCASRNRPDSPSAACRSPARSSAPHTQRHLHSCYRAPWQHNTGRAPHPQQADGSRLPRAQKRAAGVGTGVVRRATRGGSDRRRAVREAGAGRGGGQGPGRELRDDGAATFPRAEAGRRLSRGAAAGAGREGPRAAGPTATPDSPLPRGAPGCSRAASRPARPGAAFPSSPPSVNPHPPWAGGRSRPGTLQAE